MKGKSLSRVRFLATPWTTAYQAPPSMGFSRQEYWSGVLLPSPRQDNSHDKTWGPILSAISKPFHTVHGVFRQKYWSGLPFPSPVDHILSTVRTGHGTTDWFQIGKGVRQGCILSPCLFNLYAEYIMRNAGLEEAQAGIKIAMRNINNLRYADDTTLWQKVKRN